MAKKVKVKMEQGTRKVKAVETIGNLAIHHSIDDVLQLTITYIPTGQAVVSFSIAVPLKIIKPLLKELSKLLKHFEKMTDEMKRRVKVLLKALAGVSAAYASLV